MILQAVVVMIFYTSTPVSTELTINTCSHKVIENHMKIIHLNVQSLFNKTNEIELLTNEHIPDILCLTETWLTHENVEKATIPNYTLSSYFCRSTQIHGGVAIFCKESIDAKEVQFIKEHSTETHIECSGLIISNNQHKTTIINVYRPPNGDMDIFLISLSQILNKAFAVSSIVILCGDLNINSLVSSIRHKLLQDLLSSYDLTNFCTQPTRITVNKNGNSTTSIDYMISNLPEDKVTCKIFNPHISDHLAQVLLIETHFTKIPFKNVNIMRRQINDQNLSNLKASLQNESWRGIDDTNIDIGMDNFLQTFLWHLNIHCPEQNIKININKKKTRWMTDEIRRSSRELKDLYKLIKETKDPHLMEIYKEKKKSHRRKINSAKKDFNTKLINEADNKTKKVWEIVNTELGKNEKRQDIVLRENNIIIKNNNEIGNKFGNYFSTVAQSKLDDHFGNNKSNQCTASDIKINTMFFIPVDASEIKSIITNLPNKKSCGYDGVSVKILKYVTSAIVHPLVLLINSSVQQGSFPSLLKLAKIIPLFKKGDPMDIQNYRPISVLSVFSKIFEKVMHKRIVNFCNKFNVFSNSQHGFREGRSTESASYHFTQYIQNQLEKNKCVSGLFFDLSRAFDTIDIEFIRFKLDRLGLRSNILNWILSFLSHRQLYINVNNVQSQRYNINIGAAQGSTLAPLIFLLYINDLTTSGYMINFADDTSIVVSACTPEELLLAISQVDKEMNQWCHLNRLILNKDKTVRVEFHNTTPRMAPDNFAKVVKFLGSFLDSKLTWNRQIDHVCKTLNSSFYALLKLKQSVSISTLREAYFALVHSHLSYNIILWGRAVEINRVFIIQKRILRLIFNLGHRESCREIFQTQNILTVCGVYILNSAVFVYNNSNLFSKNNDQHHYSTRYSAQLSVPLHHSSKFEKSPYYSCIKVYNKLPDNLKNSRNKYNFKKNLKSYLSTHVFYNLNEFFNS